MSQASETVTRDELRELHQYAREFFRVQMSWFVFVGMANVVALLAFFSEGIALEVATKPPLSVGFSLLNLVTAGQFVVRGLNFQLLGKQIEQRRAVLGSGVEQREDVAVPLELMIRTGRLSALATAMLVAAWAVCCFHVWKHETLPTEVFTISIVVFVIVSVAIGTVLGKQIMKCREQLAEYD